MLSFGAPSYGVSSTIVGRSYWASSAQVARICFTC